MDRHLQIEQIMDALECTWRRYPKMSLLQLIHAATRRIDNRNTSDDHFLNALIEFRYTNHNNGDK